MCFIILIIFSAQNFICHLITHLCKMKSLWSSSTGSLSLSKVVRIINILVWLLNKNWLAFKQAYKCFIVSFQKESLGWLSYCTWQYSHGTSNEILRCPHILRSQINTALSTQNFWERFTNRGSNSSPFVRAWWLQYSHNWNFSKGNGIIRVFHLFMACSNYWFIGKKSWNCLMV